MKRFLLTVLCCTLFFNPCNSQKREIGKVTTVVIDPGHGGDKPGAIGKHCKEKDIVLQVAKKFGSLIQANYPDVKVIYTRTTDADVSLSGRAHLANTSKADLFISIHANSHPTSAPTGVETFVMGLSKSKANMEVAKKENADILLEQDYQKNSAYQGFDPYSPENSIIFALYQNAYLDKSLDFASLIQKEYGSHIKSPNRGVKNAEFMVLYLSAMPAVLTEIGFISNPSEEAFMMSDFGQATIAVSLFEAFMRYKCKEEGLPLIAKPIIDLPGYGKNAVQAKPEEKTPVAPEKKDEPQALKDTTHSKADSTACHAAPALASAPDSTTAKADKTETAPAKADNTAASEKEKPVFKVQFLTADRILKPGASQLRGETDYETYKDGGSIRYLKGNAGSIREAKEIQSEMRNKGFKDAFVIAFYKGARISVQQAREMLEQ